MSWSPELFIGDLRPWPDTVHVVRGKTDEMQRYVPERNVPERTCHDLRVFDSWDMFTCSSCKALILRNAVHFNIDGFTDNSIRFCPNCGAKVVDE